MLFSLDVGTPLALFFTRGSLAGSDGDMVAPRNRLENKAVSRRREHDPADIIPAVRVLGMRGSAISRAGATG
jgi:hypothetical protein